MSASATQGGNNKAIADHTSSLCTLPLPPPRQRRDGPFCFYMTLYAANALQCVVNGEKNPQTHTDTQTHVLTTIQ